MWKIKMGESKILVKDDKDIRMSKIYDEDDKEKGMGPI